MSVAANGSELRSARRRTPMALAAGSAAVALVAAVITSGVVAVTAAPVTTTTTPTTTTSTTTTPNTTMVVPKPVELSEQAVRLSCTDSQPQFAVLASMSAGDALLLDTYMNETMWLRTSTIDRSLCEGSTKDDFEEDSGGGDSDDPDADKEKAKGDRNRGTIMSVDLMVGPYETLERACDVMQQIKQQVAWYLVDATRNQGPESPMTQRLKNLQAALRVDMPGYGPSTPGDGSSYGPNAPTCNQNSDGSDSTESGQSTTGGTPTPDASDEGRPSPAGTPENDNQSGLEAQSEAEG